MEGRGWGGIRAECLVTSTVQHTQSLSLRIALAVKTR